MFDKNQDGTVLVSDLRQILSHLGEVIPEDEIDALFRRLGYTDVIRYEEFAKMLLMSDDCVVCWYCFFLSSLIGILSSSGVSSLHFFQTGKLKSPSNPPLSVLE